MKQWLLSILWLLSMTSLGAQAKVGEITSNIQFNTILNAGVPSASLDQLKGKVVLLEFWATWCSPCVDAMPHLQQLQEKFKDRLQIVTVSTETEKRVRAFLQNQPSNLWFAVDTGDVFRLEFPYHTIPHSVLIDPKGTVVAITEPGNINSQVIERVLLGKHIDLPVKVDNMDQDPWTTFFSADTAIKSRFLIQPKIDGVGSGSKTYPTDSVFKDRRITLMNMSIEGAYRIAYGNIAYDRSVDLTPKKNALENKKLYGIDVIVSRGSEAELLPTLRRELQGRFDLKASLEQQRRPVYILTISDTSKVALLKKSSGPELFSANHGAFSGEGIPLKRIADYLEGFGLEDLPVVDETNDTGTYDIHFTYMPEKNGDLEATLGSMGFALTKTERTIEVLVFR